MLVLPAGDSLRHFFRIWRRVERGVPLTVVRYADGEEALMQGSAIPATATVGVEDGWWVEAGMTRLGRDLLATLHHREPAYMYGIPGTNDLASVEFFRRTLTASPEQLTFASLFCNMNYRYFRERLGAFTEGVVIVASRHGAGRPVGGLRVLEYVPMEHDCVNHWERAHQDERVRAADVATRFERTLFLVSAGPMAEVLIDTMFTANPTNRYLDVGSALDELIHGRKTRPYMHAGTSFAQHISRF